MKDFGYIIKISDLLLNPGKKDIIKFDNKFTKKIPNLTNKGIKGEVHLEWLNSGEIKVTLKNIHASLKDTCGTCWEDFEREVIVPFFDTKFVLPSRHHNITEQIHDEEFIINTKNETINIEDLVVQSILLQEPLVSHCPTHFQWSDEIELEQEETNFGGTIVFKKW